jgi:class 3 adenylate cyclase/tetratricopeptide (TPR) repeat protein
LAFGKKTAGGGGREALTVFMFGPFVLDVGRRWLKRGDERLTIPRKSFDVLRLLVEADGRLVEREAIYASLWPNVTVEDRNLTVHVSILRKALNGRTAAADFIETVPGLGYRLTVPVCTAPSAPPLSAAPQPAQTPPITVPASAAGVASPGGLERRQLTIMACNLASSAPPSASHDPEELHDQIAVFHAVVADAVSGCDGFVAQYLNDGVLVYFGHPVAHEHDAERAVRAGLAAVDAVGRLKGASGASLRASVGIATGLVVVGEPSETANARQYGAIGTTPTLAARLQSAASPGEIVIAASTWRLAGRMFDCREFTLNEGQPQPVPAWRVRGEAVGVTRFEARRSGALSHLAGREEEIDLLRRRWDQSKLGEGRVVLLSGEPGVGKSRIAEDLLASLKGEPHTSVRYFCSPHHTNSPLYPFVEQLEKAANFAPDMIARARLDKLEALLEPTSTNLPSDLALVAALLGVPVDERCARLAGGPQQKREMTLVALLDHLVGQSVRSPVLVVFEDIHWIDPTSLDLLDRIVAAAADLPVFLLITFRLEFQPAWIGQPQVTTLSLSRLGRRDSAGIIGSVAKGKALPSEVVDQILSHADGIPLFIEELTSSLLESGVLRESSGGYVMDGPLPPLLAIPTTLQASLVARFDRLGPAKDTALIGAAIGREFSHKLLAAVSALSPGDLDAALARLTASGLVSRRGMPPDTTYSFKHALVRDAVYATMLRSRRQQLHATIGNALVEHFPALAESLPEVAARHFTEAGLAGAAIGHWRKAGRLALARFAVSEAAESFEQALRVLEAQPESQSTLGEAFDTLLELRPVLIQLGEPRRAMERLRKAEALAERLNDDRRRGWVCALMTNLHSLVRELDEAQTSGTRALEIAERLGDLRLRIPATSYLVQAHYYRGDYERVVALATDNLAVLPAAWVDESFGMSVPPSVWDRCYLMLSLAQLGRFAEAAEPEAEAIRLAEATQQVYAIGLAHFVAGWVLLQRGNWAQAHRPIERATAVMRAGNVANMLATSVACSAWILAQLGEADRALDRLREGERLFEQLSAGRSYIEGGVLHGLGYGGLALGRLDEAQRIALRALEVTSLHLGWRALALHLLGDIATHPERFDAKQGEAHYQQALALAEPRGMRPLVAHCRLGLGKLYRRTRRGKQALEQLAAATTMYREMDMPFWLEQAESELRQLQSLSPRPR